MDIIQKITDSLKVRRGQVEAAVKLIDEGNTIPFIARYRKEATGSLDDEQLRSLSEQLTYLRALEEKKEQVLSSIEGQGKLTDELRSRIENAQTQVAVDDLYRPYRPKRKTRASIAKEKGLEPLAEYILAQNAGAPLESEAARYVNNSDASVPEELRVNSPEEALAGASDIIAEQISDDADIRTYIRNTTMEKGTIRTQEKPAEKPADSSGKTSAASEKTAKSKAVPSVSSGEKANKKLEERRGVYEMYYNFEEPLKDIPGHRILAINRGEKEKFLTVTVCAPEEDILEGLGTRILKNPKHPNVWTAPFLEECIRDSYTRLIAPAIEREIRSELTDRAEDGAIRVFRGNLTQLLMQPPITGRVVLGWDPAFRTGCKIAVVDATGKVLDTTVVFPTAPQMKVEETKRTIKALIAKYHVTLISLGNGTASRESEQVIVSIIKEYAAEHPKADPVQYVIVNEAGASVYSASKLATEEFPEFDVGQRSAASMARRLEDPLAELVKIDPKAIGVGQYQHDCNEKKLDEALGGVVEDCVNKVGVDLNTASFSLLSYISGISVPVAKNIVSYREANGAFRNRRELLKVPKLGPKAFEQCAGFLRISGGSEPLDGTAVHPEDYTAVKTLLKELGLSDDPSSFRMAKILVRDRKKTAERLGIGEVTLSDILSELEKPARDPREDMPKPVLKSNVLSMDDLVPGMKLKGTVRNIVDFGVFVDIGVHQDGLVHISRLSDHFVKNPMDVVKVGDVVDVTVVSVDTKKNRIALSMNGKM
ncbi:MAG: Tex family protein [Lachnospiraceae bacterium]|nr:Tex family protein [Lachnospiraceae bacterium]